VIAQSSRATENSPGSRGTLGHRIGVDGGAMCRGDGADDGETESVAVLVDRSARIKPLERLEEAFNFGKA
jgi:hypothetical protein